MSDKEGVTVRVCVPTYSGCKTTASTTQMKYNITRESSTYIISLSAVNVQSMDVTSCSAVHEIAKRWKKFSKRSGYSGFAVPRHHGGPYVKQTSGTMCRAVYVEAVGVHRCEQQRERPLMVLLLVVVK